MTNTKTMLFMVAALVAAAEAGAQSRLLGSPLRTGGARTLRGSAGGARPTAGGGSGDVRASAGDITATGAGASSSSGPSASASAVDADAEKEKASALNFMEAPLEMVFEVYAQLVDRTVLKDPGTPAATITIQSRPGQTLTKEEQIEAIEVVLEMNGVHMEDYGEKFVRALPRDKVRQEGIPLILDEDAELAESGKVVSMMIPFENIPIPEAKEILDQLKSQRGLLLGYERIGKILATDTQQNIKRMRQVAREIDVAIPVNENVFVRQIKNANATDIQTAIQKIVEESQKQLEKESAAAKAGRTGANTALNRPASNIATQPSGTLLRRPGMPPQPNQPKPTTPTVQSIVTSVTDADRGMIRGKVVIVPDERSNKLIFVTSKTNMDFFDKVIESLDVETTPDTVVKVYRLKYATAEDVSDMINDLIGNAQKSSSRENQNAASRSGQSSNLTRSQSQRPATTATKPSVNKRTGEPKAGELTKDNTTVLADKRINGLVVMTQKELVPTVESIIESMDVKLSQVVIETAIVEVTLGESLETGIDWVQRGRQHQWSRVQATDGAGRTLYKVYDDRGTYIGNAASGQSLPGLIHNDDGTTQNTTYTPDVSDENIVYKTVKTLTRDGLVNNGSYMLGGGGGWQTSLLNTMMAAGTNAVSGATWGGANPIGGGLNYLLKSDKLNIAAVVKAAQDDSRSKYVASPIVMTVDNKEAKIEATQMRYLLKGYTYSGSTYNGTTVPDYEQKEIGLTITVTPKINPNGTVMLTVEEEYSQVGANQTIQANIGGTTTSSVSVPTTITRKMSADITLENMQTVVLGGLTETSTSDSSTGIPLLKDIPWVGEWLFSWKTQSEDRKELLVFMTPYVLDDGDAAQAEARRRKNALSDPRPWENYGWSASELADPIPNKELMRRLKDEAKKQDEERQNRIAIEKWKLERAKALEKMSDAERKFWMEQHRDELEKEKKDEFDRQVKGMKEQEDLKEFVEELRRKNVAKAEEKIKAAEEQEKQKRDELDKKKEEEMKKVDEVKKADEVKKEEPEKKNEE